MSEWNSKNKPGVKTRDPEYPDLTTDFADPSNDNNQYRGKDNLVGWYRFLGDGAVGRVDGGTTNTFPNLAKTGSDGQTLTTSGSLGSAVYYEESLYGAAVTYKARYQSPFKELNFDIPVGAASVVSDQWGYSFNQQVTPYLTANMANGALPFSGSKAEQNYFRITDTDNWNIYASGAEFSVAVWVRMNNYQNGQQQSDNFLPLITKIKQGTDWSVGGEFSMTWYPSAITEMNLRAYVMSDDSDYQYGRSGYFNANSATNEMNDDSYPEPLAELPPNGSWVHVVMTWNGTNTDSGTTKPSSNSTDAVKTYINGHFMLYDNVGSGFGGDIRPATNSTCGDILINAGRDDDEPTNLGKYTNQDIAEVAFWSKCLSPKEVKALYHGTTQGIKKYDSGFVKNPARPQLQRLDDTSGNAYPTMAGSADQKRRGLRTPFFDDTLTRVFTQSNGSVNMGARLRSDDKLISASFSTPNKIPTLTVDTSVHSNSDNAGRVDARIMGNLPFLTASVTEFKDPYTPFDESRIYIDSNIPFYQSGTLRAPGLNQRLADKATVTIPIAATKATRLGIQNQKGVEQWFMAYWNKDDNNWEAIGRGFAGTQWNLPALATSDKEYFINPPGDYYGKSPNNPWGFYEGPMQRNANFACMGFTPIAGYEPVFANYSTAPYDTDTGELLNSALIQTWGRPTDAFGFPFHQRYHATGSQIINMNDYIDSPFLVEKMVIHYSASAEMSSEPNGSNGQTKWMQIRPGPGGTAVGKFNFYDTKDIAQCLNWFILRQRPAQFNNIITQSFGYYADSKNSKIISNRAILTTSIPGLRCTNQDGQNNQTSFERVSTTRDMITYAQHVIHGQNNPNGTALPDDGEKHSVGELVNTHGMGRDLYTGPLDMQNGNRRGTSRQTHDNWWFGTDNLGGGGWGLTGSFVLSASIRTAPVNRNGPTFRANFPGTWNPLGAWETAGYYAFTTMPSTFGGRGGPQNSLGDRRGFFNQLPSGRSGSETGYQFNTYYNVAPDGSGFSGLTKLTCSDAYTYSAEVNDSPYLMMPGDQIVIGVQASMGNEPGDSWPCYTGSSPVANNASTWASNYMGYNIEMLPDPNARITFYGSYLKNHAATTRFTGQQLTTVACHGAISGGPVLDQWEIDLPQSYSGSYLTQAVSGAMTSPVAGWPREPAQKRRSLWASASSTPPLWASGSGGYAPADSITFGGPVSGSYPDRGTPFDGSIKPWVSSSAYHSSSVYGNYFGSRRDNAVGDGSGTGVMLDWIGGPDGPPSQPSGQEPASNRSVGATTFDGNTGDVFGFQRNVRLTCPDETYYDSLAPDPSVCWIADNQQKTWNGGQISEILDSSEFVTLGIGASMGGNQAGIAVTGGTAKYSNEWWLPSFPFEARYRGFSEPPEDDYKRKIEQNAVYSIRLCLPSFATQNSKTQAWSTDASAGALPNWMGFDPLGTTRNQTNQSAKCVGVVGMYIDGLKPGLARSATADWAGAINSTTDIDMEGTILPVLFGFGTGLSGSVSPYKRVAATGTSTYDDGAYKYLSNKPRGCKYGLYSWKPRVTSTIFRSNRFGQMRDMLEQRRYSRFFISSDGAVETNAPVVCQFKEPIWLDPISDIDKAAFDTQCSNLSLFATSSVPYFDGEVKNRGPLVADGSDTIVIE